MSSDVSVMHGLTELTIVIVTHKTMNLRSGLYSIFSGYGFFVGIGIGKWKGMDLKEKNRIV